jgi:GPI mannosyltransferase 2
MLSDLRLLLNADTILTEAWVGIIISHLAHFVAVQALYNLSLKLFRTAPSAQTIPYTTACLHIISPAGIFLSAPFSESLFAALQFLGYDAYIGAWSSRSPVLAAQCFRLLLAGLCFGLAMLVRSNGLLSGILFAYDAVELGRGFISGRRTLSVLILLAATVTAGSWIALGAVFPQFLAYQQYCQSSSELRPWCFRWVPSIYTFVQVHYW